MKDYILDLLKYDVLKAETMVKEATLGNMEFCFMYETKTEALTQAYTWLGKAQAALKFAEERL